MQWELRSHLTQGTLVWPWTCSNLTIELNHNWSKRNGFPWALEGPISSCYSATICKMFWDKPMTILDMKHISEEFISWEIKWLFTPFSDQDQADIIFTKPGYLLSLQTNTTQGIFPLTIPLKNITMNWACWHHWHVSGHFVRHLYNQSDSLWRWQHDYFVLFQKTNMLPLWKSTDYPSFSAFATPLPLFYWIWIRSTEKYFSHLILTSSFGSNQSVDHLIKSSRELNKSSAFFVSCVHYTLPLKHHHKFQKFISKNPQAILSYFYSTNHLTLKNMSYYFLSC